MTDAYILPLINQGLDECIQYLSNTCSPFDTKLVTLPNLNSGTTDLRPFIVPQTQPGDSNQPALLGLMDPQIVEWKVAGQPDVYYRQATRMVRLPNYTPAAPQPLYQMAWEWRSYSIWITPMTYNVDLRVRGEFRPPPLVKDDDYISIHPNLTYVLAYFGAALAENERNNVAKAQDLKAQGIRAIDDIANELVRAEQNPAVRLGRITGGYRNRTFWP